MVFNRKDDAPLKHELPRTSTPGGPAPSAGMLVWGIVALVIGQALYQSGQQQALVDSLTGSLFSNGGGDGQMLAGALISLFGIIWLLIGVHRLASGVDELVRGRAIAHVAAPRPAAPKRPVKDVLPPAVGTE